MTFDFVDQFDSTTVFQNGAGIDPATVDAAARCVLAHCGDDAGEVLAALGIEAQS